MQRMPNIEPLAYSERDEQNRSLRCERCSRRPSRYYHIFHTVDPVRYPALEVCWVCLRLAARNTRGAVRESAVPQIAELPARDG